MGSVPAWVQRQVRREVKARIDAQIRAYGVDPQVHVLVMPVQMLDGSTEWRALGATYPHRAALMKAGFQWDRRGFWVALREPQWSALAGVDYRLRHP